MNESVVLADSSHKKCRILGISAYYHDSAAALLTDGEIVAAAQEERFTRKKHDSAFPVNAIQFCLQKSGQPLSDIDYLVFYDKPLVKFERLLETYLSFAPMGLRSFVKAMPIWLKEKLYLKTTLKREFSTIGNCKPAELPTLLFTEHHHSHAASAFYFSPFENAAVLCLDGVGEWATTTAWYGEAEHLTPLWEIDFPHSLGLMYSAFTYFTGFRVNSGEYKLMGLAPYGDPKYVSLILDKIIDVKDDGTFRLNMTYFDYCTGLTMTNRRFESLFGRSRRSPEARLTQDDMDIAASIQIVTEQIVSKLAKTIHQETGANFLCLAGGVALNCVANGKLLRESPFDDIWIQPAAGDAGGAIGCAAVVWHEKLGHPNHKSKSDRMKGTYLGPAFSTAEAIKILEDYNADYEELPDSVLYDRLAKILDDGLVVGWFQGKMEFGPRALGGRSIIGDARNSNMQSVMNLKIKYRESFRPFAPSVLEERLSDYFDLDRPSPYMLIVAPVREELRVPLANDEKQLFGIEKLRIPRSQIPAITHVDYSARVQTVSEETNPRYHRLLKAFDSRTGCGLLVNTSFNVRGEPIVCTPEDAYRCFMRTEMDYLVIGNLVFDKLLQPEWGSDDSWHDEFELD